MEKGCAKQLLKTRKAGLSKRQTTRKTVLKRAVTVRGHGVVGVLTGAPVAAACCAICCCSRIHNSEANSNVTGQLKTQKNEHMPVGE